MDVTAHAALDRTLLLTRQQRLPDARDKDILAAFADTAVCIVADERNLRSAAAQAMVSTLSGLVFACGMRVRLVMPEVAIVGYQPPLLGDELPAALIGLSAASVPGGEAS